MPYLITKAEDIPGSYAGYVTATMKREEGRPRLICPCRHDGQLSWIYKMVCANNRLFKNPRYAARKPRIRQENTYLVYDPTEVDVYCEMNQDDPWEGLRK